MQKRKSICGLCKPTKKWKRRNVRKTNFFKKSVENDFSVGVKLRVSHK